MSRSHREPRFSSNTVFTTLNSRLTRILTQKVALTPQVQPLSYPNVSMSHADVERGAYTDLFLSTSLRTDPTISKQMVLSVFHGSHKTRLFPFWSHNSQLGNLALRRGLAMGTILDKLPPSSSLPSSIGLVVGGWWWMAAQEDPRHEAMPSPYPFCQLCKEW
jgi:hypothetical protein